MLSIPAIPLGDTNFARWVRQELAFVDKSLFIDEVFSKKSAHVTLITRPRRFGKTSLLTMLLHFLSDKIYGQPTQGLFDSLKINRINPELVQKEQGQHPTIFISLKSINGCNFDSAIKSIQQTLQKVCQQHLYLLDSSQLLDFEKEQFNALLTASMADPDQLSNALYFLSLCLFKHHGKPCWILLDEYDTPLYAAHSYGYWEAMINFMRCFLGNALKDNYAVEKSVNHWYFTHCP